MASFRGSNALNCVLVGAVILVASYAATERWLERKLYTGKRFG